MAHIDWNSDYALGNDMLDRQHRKLIELYNAFDRMARTGSDLETPVTKTLEALQLLHEYMLYHFRYEETVMANQGYPKLARHWRQHKDFDYKLFAYIRRLETGLHVEPDEVLELIRLWILEHIQGEDKEMQSYLQERAEEGHA